jgi:Zn-finger nucleic acid-binding protein
MKVQGVICPNEECGVFVYSRAGHDMRYCPCGDVAADGGREYLKVAFKKVAPKVGDYECPVSAQALYDDWNTHKDVYGHVPADKVAELVTVVESEGIPVDKDLPEDSPWPSPEEKAYWTPKGAGMAMSVVAKVNTLDHSEKDWQKELIDFVAVELAKLYALVARERNLVSREAMMEGLKRAAAEMDENPIIKPGKIN